MLDYTIDILLVGFVVVLFIQLLKTPIKAVLTRKGLGENEKMSKIFNAVVTFLSYVLCFVGACIYFRYVKHYPLFEDSRILTYTVGVVGASQTIYKVLETYGRDGLFAIIKAIIERIKSKESTKIEALATMTFDEFASKIYEGIQERFEDASITEDDVKQIIQEKISNHD